MLTQYKIWIQKLYTVFHYAFFYTNLIVCEQYGITCTSTFYCWDFELIFVLVSYQIRDHAGYLSSNRMSLWSMQNKFYPVLFSHEDFEILINLIYLFKWDKSTVLKLKLILFRLSFITYQEIFNWELVASEHIPD